eukprot:CAMPEP_0184292940 /NCGR_PEP_ID=MMETSP1049-20130417/4584_1 /TAXON_ID=77928 /ORGANISM="Proteomonas sulcata, Strain CCMP704" /LENGTH=439 /DNA_ID=CAMNT_0026600863 /DNA_START=101 /DNA_END=1420 /DNA_ORIENTATION=-
MLEVNEEEDEGPSEVNTTKTSHLVKVHKDKLTVTYNGKANHTQDVGAVQANKPFPKKVLIGYFEMRVIDAGTRGCMAIGLGNASFNVTRHPGWEPGSYGYHGDTGRKFCSPTRGEPYGAKYGAEDIVGCGINFRTREIFFTKNGKNLGVAFTEPGASYFPTIGLHSEGETVELNFGQKPFKFLLEDMLREEREKFQQTVSRIPLGLADVNELVRAYLWYEGHAESLKSFEAAASLPPISSSEAMEGSTEQSEDFLLARSAVRGLIMDGKLEEAIEVINDKFPDFLASNPRAESHLYCQQFIELLHTGSKSEAVAFARKVLSKYLEVQHAQNGQNGSSGMDGPASSQSQAETAEYVQGVVGLLAYPDPLSQSPLSHLLQSNYRKVVADVVNCAIHEHVGGEGSSALQRLTKQLLASHDTLRQLQGGRGEVLDLSDVISRS